MQIENKTKQQQQKKKKTKKQTTNKQKKPHSFLDNGGEKERLASKIMEY